MSQEGKIKVGVLGVGALGRHHARLYQESEMVELAGVYDVDAERASGVAQEVGVKAFASPDQLAEEVEALSVAVPTNLHYEVGKAMLEKGKHLLMEKPITQSIDQARDLLRIANEKRLVVMVGHVERFNPVISYLEEKLDSPRFIESHRLSPYPPPRKDALPRGTEVSVVLDLMIHDIDMVLNLVKSEVASIDAVGVPILSQTEDIANVRLKFENGCVANLTASRVTPEPMRKIRVFQRNTYLSLDYQSKSGEIYFKETHKIRREAVPVADHNALLIELEHFAGCVKTLEESGEMPAPKVSGEQGLRALELADAMIRQMREANPLRIGM